MDALTAFKNDLTRYLRGRLATAGDVQVAGEYPPGLQNGRRGAAVWLSAWMGPAGRATQADASG